MRASDELAEIMARLEKAARTATLPDRNEETRDLLYELGTVHAQLRFLQQRLARAEEVMLDQDRPAIATLTTEQS